MTLPLKYYLSGEYHVQILREDIGGGETIFVARLRSLPGCAVQAPSEAEARRLLEEAREPYLRSLYRAGADLPRPDAPSERPLAESIFFMGPQSSVASAAERPEKPELDSRSVGVEDLALA